jgi:hypothetical protein
MHGTLRRERNRRHQEFNARKIGIIGLSASLITVSKFAEGVDDANLDNGGLRILRISFESFDS